MNLWRLARRNIAGSSFRSWVVFGCTLVVTGLALSTILLINGAQQSLQLAVRRLGADLMVVPQGTETRVETALLMGTPVQVWMPDTKVAEIATVPGVAQASPQLFLSSLKGAACCSASEMFMVAYDPQTDFTVTPWLKNNLGRGLKLGESIGGTSVFIPEGEQNIKLYGYYLTLRGNLEPTGTNLDQTMFLTWETAEDMAHKSYTQAEKPLIIPDNSISALLVKVAPGAKAHDVAEHILTDVPGVTPIESTNMFQTYRQQITGLLRAMTLLLSVTVILSLALISFIFAMAANERRREMGVLRALGATRGLVLRSLLAEAGLLALAGALPGILLSVFCVLLFRTLLIRILGVPFLVPSAGDVIVLVVGTLVMALVGVGLAALLPAWRISRLDPSIAMRE